MKKQPRWGEIWTVDYTSKYADTKNASFEIESRIKKLRPSLVISNNIWNSFEKSVLVIPFARKVAFAFTRVPFEISIEANVQNGLEVTSNLLLGEMRPVSIENRLLKLVGKLDHQQMTVILSGISFLTADKKPS